ncbi:MAG: 16S rRNA (guanine(527)-N(7))-methyltransferase RsmG [Flammeovirgaceae bacterium]|nr:16S rRNA (guanine(527)-N(7))-methyltransferase RsmG [Flammeovirgaceae bacterium]MDW8287278.1 16S rRNA (guanine(527)-N(7))-methyltransferase RsmG [Flammeovirgaceae bacterium]
MDIVLKYFPNLTETQKTQFASLFDLYKEWNSKINVISKQDIDNLYERHVLHSLAIAKVIAFQAGSRVMDLGTGGGFPGVPLAIYFPDTYFLLVDSVGKKIKVVQEVIQTIGLKNASAVQIRAEDVVGTFDFVVSRAVADISTLYRWARDKVSKQDQHPSFKNGIFCLKGGDLREEFAKFKHYHQFYPISNFFEEEFFKEKKVVYALV